MFDWWPRLGAAGGGLRWYCKILQKFPTNFTSGFYFLKATLIRNLLCSLSCGMHRWVSSLLGPALGPSLGSAWAQHSGQPRPAQGNPLGAVTEYRYNHCHKSKIEIIHRYRIVTIPPTPRCTLRSINSRSRYPIGRARSEGQQRERERAHRGK